MLLFAVFAVTQEDFVHSMPVVELLWRSCSQSTEHSDAKGADLRTRLKVRSWTQLLVDHSLLLGSSTKGVHLHDIVLTYPRLQQKKGCPPPPFGGGRFLTILPPK